MGLAEGLGRGAIPPRQRAEDLFPGLKAVPGDRPRAFEPQVQVGGQPDPRLAAGRHHLGLPVAVSGVAPGTALAAVIESRLAFHDEIDRPVHAPDRPQQDPFGPVVYGHPPVRARPGGGLPPWPDQQDVPDDGPARRGGPRGFQHHRPRQVAPSGRDGGIRRAQPEPPGGPVQDRGEDARAVHPGQAHPFHIAAGRDQRGRLAIGKKPILSDRGKRASAHRGRTRMRTTGQSFRHQLHPHQPARELTPRARAETAAPAPGCRRYAPSQSAPRPADLSPEGPARGARPAFRNMGDGEFWRR